MSAMLSTQSLVLATAMAISAGTLLLLDLLWTKSPTNQNQTLPKSCLSSGKKQSKGKKVRFAVDVKESSGNGEEYRKEQKMMILDFPNRKALYDGMLKARFQRMEYSF